MDRNTDDKGSESQMSVTKAYPERPSEVLMQEAASSTSMLCDSSHSESEASDKDSGSEEETQIMTSEPLSEKEVNEISAKILRAELMGDEVGAKRFISLLFLLTCAVKEAH